MGPRLSQSLSGRHLFLLQGLPRTPSYLRQSLFRKLPYHLRSPRERAATWIPERSDRNRR